MTAMLLYVFPSLHHYHEAELWPSLVADPDAVWCQLLSHSPDPAILLCWPHHPPFLLDLGALLKLSRLWRLPNELVMFTVGGVITLKQFTCILVSYGHRGHCRSVVPQPKESAKHCPRVAPISCRTYTMGQYLGSTSSQHWAISLTRTSLWLSCTRWSRPCWISSSTALGTRT